MGTKDTLRTLREYLNLSIQEVAEGAKVSFRTVLRAEKGDPLNPESRKRLCKFYGKTSEELGLVAQRRRARGARGDASYQRKPEQVSNDFGTLQNTIRCMLVAICNLEQRGIDMEHSRHCLLRMLETAGLALVVPPQELLCSSVLENRRGQITEVSASIIENLAQITQQYRSFYLIGLIIEDGLRSHIDLIENALENTIHEEYRCELWRMQAQCQLLARQAAVRKREFGRARTCNESAIAAAQFSGDTFLLGAALGHLGHLYLILQQNPVAARQLLNQAQEYTREHPVNGWFAMLGAAIAAEELNRDECKASIARAMQIVQEMPHTAEYTDLYYTDFNVAGTNAFAGDCLLKVGEPMKALEQLTSIDLDTLAENRHASVFYDLACAHAVLYELEAMQGYAFRSIDKALTTNRLYIIPRFVNLAQKIQEKDRHESHACAIVEYANVALQNSKAGCLSNELKRS